MSFPPLLPEDPIDVVRVALHARPSRRRVQFRYFLDSHLFRRLCDPGQAAALGTFRASLERSRLTVAGSVPDFEMTPLAVLDVMGIKNPRIPAYTVPAGLEAVVAGSRLKGWAWEELERAPDLQPEKLRSRVGELRQEASPEALDLFDLCLTRGVAREDFKDTLRSQLSFDYVFRRHYPEHQREGILRMLKATLFDTRTSVAGLTQMRAIKVSWDRTYERLLKVRSESQEEIQAIDQEIKPRLFQDYLGWEVIHHAILGYPAQGAFHPVIAFTLDSEETLVARCRAYKTALRACLEQYSPEDRATVLRPRMDAWKPGWLVPCRVDGTLGSPISTGELAIL